MLALLSEIPQRAGRHGHTAKARSEWGGVAPQGPSPSAEVPVRAWLGLSDRAPMEAGSQDRHSSASGNGFAPGLHPEGPEQGFEPKTVWHSPLHQTEKKGKVRGSFCWEQPSGALCENWGECPPSPRVPDKGWEHRTGKAGFLLASGSGAARPDQEFPAEQAPLLPPPLQARAATRSPYHEHPPQDLSPQPQSLRCQNVRSHFLKD